MCARLQGLSGGFCENPKTRGFVQLPRRRFAKLLNDGQYTETGKIEKNFNIFPMNLIDGRKVAKHITEKAAHDCALLGFTPGFAAVIVGDDPASHLYVSLK